MVLDINYFRDENLLKQLKESENRRCETNSVVDKVIEADNEWRKATYTYEQLKKNLNEISKKISEYTKLNKGKIDIINDNEFINLKNLAESKKQGIINCLKNIEECNEKRNTLLKLVGNIVSNDVIASKDESLNQILRSWVPNFFPWESKQTDSEIQNKGVCPNYVDSSLNSNQSSDSKNHDSLQKICDFDGTHYVNRVPEFIKRPPWKVLQHHEILARLNSLEVTKGVEVAGHRGFFLKGAGCLLNLALIQYGFNFLVRKGFLPIHTPYLMRKEIMSECAELADFEETLYCIPPNNVSCEYYDNSSSNGSINCGITSPNGPINTTNTGPNSLSSITPNSNSNTSFKDKKKEKEEKEKDFDRNKLFLIATSEQPIAALHRNETYQKKQLPLMYAGLSTCFRREAGAHGKDLRGIFRVHQFQKVEQFVVCTPEQSAEFHEQMMSHSEEFYRSLKLPYRVVSIVAGALNRAASKKYDLEAWFPGYEDYRELVSCSNCTDYQSRNLNSKYYDKNNQDRKHVHMLNGTLVASQRCLCCILENYQTPDGIIVPEALVPYMDGQVFIPFPDKSS